MSKGKSGPGCFQKYCTPLSRRYVIFSGRALNLEVASLDELGG
jgi:hypothetical protein